MTLEKTGGAGIGAIGGLKLAVLDMTGTTVIDDGLVERAFAEAITHAGVPPETQRFAGMVGYARDTMGISKMTVFTHLFEGDMPRAREANATFERAYDELVATGGVHPVPGAEEAINWCRDAGIKVCLTTGFARHTQNIVLESLGWMGLADLSLCPADAGHGRPYPDMILTAALALDMDDIRQTVVVGDTTADIQAGLRSGASMVTGVLSGAHSAPALSSVGATDILDTVAQLPDLVAPFVRI